MKESRLGQARRNAAHSARFDRGKTVYSTESIHLLQFRPKLMNSSFDNRFHLVRDIDFLGGGPQIHGSARAPFWQTTENFIQGNVVMGIPLKYDGLIGA